MTILLLISLSLTAVILHDTDLTERSLTYKLYFFKDIDLRLTFLMTVTCPRYPAVPLSISGMSAARHILLTWFRAATEKHQYLQSDNLVQILYNVNQRM